MNLITCVCGYECAKRNFIRHRKTCKAIPIYEEKIKLESDLADMKRMYTLATTTTNEELLRHNMEMKQILKHKDDQITQKDDHISFKDDQIAQKDDQIAQKDEQIAQKDDQIKQLQSALVAKPTTNNDIRIINLIPFGQEPLPDAAKVRSLLSRPSESIPRYIKLKYIDSNDGVPNIQIPNIRSNEVRVVEEKDGKRVWTLKDKKRTLESMAESNLSEMVDEYDARSSKSWKQWYESSGLGGEGYDKTESFKDLVHDINLTLLNHRSPS